MPGPILKQIGATLVLGGLHYIKGNSLPYFSLTLGRWGRQDGQKVVMSSGRPRDEDLAKVPEFSELNALHLSDVNGLPVHAVENGWYWLCGAVPGHYGAKYHGGNGSPARSSDECLDILAKHFRIDREKAETLCKLVTSKDELASWVETQKPRYRDEAERVIKAHNLVIFGDTYIPQAA